MERGQVCAPWIVGAVGLVLIGFEGHVASSAPPSAATVRAPRPVASFRDRVVMAVSPQAADRELSEGIAAVFATGDAPCSTITFLLERHTERLKAIVDTAADAASPEGDAGVERRALVLAERDARSASQELREDVLALCRSSPEEAQVLQHLREWTRRAWFRSGLGPFNYVGQGIDLAAFVREDPASNALLIVTEEDPGRSSRLVEILDRYEATLESRIAEASRVASDHLLAASRLPDDGLGRRTKLGLLALRERVLVAADVWRFAVEVRQVIADVAGESAAAMWGERFLQRSAPPWFGRLTREESSIFARCDIHVAIGAAPGEVPADVMSLATARWDANTVLFDIMDRALRRGEFVPCKDGSVTHEEIIALRARLDRTVARLVGVRDVASWEIRWGETSFAE